MTLPSAPEVDRLLLAFLESSDGPETERLLAELIAGHAEPLIKRILRRRLRPSLPGPVPELYGLEDVAGVVVVRLLARLRELKAGRNRIEIRDFACYVAAVTYRTQSEHLRRKYPQRHRLKSTLRHLLSRSPSLALWKAESGLLCGLASWRGRPRGAGAARPAGAAPPELWLRGRRSEFLVALFEAAGQPLELDELVAVVSEACGIRGDTTVRGDPALDAVAGGEDVAARTLDRLFLRQLWAEIRLLPLRQRQALLLNLRDTEARDVVALLPATGVASLREIADALEIPAEEMARLWSELPLDDRSLARRMSLERQQVINLRAAARRRLARRLLSGNGAPPC